MAVPFGNSVDLRGNELRNAVLMPLASAPTTPTNGYMYYDTTLHRPRIYRNGAWADFSDGSVTSVTGAAPITSTGGTTPEIGITAATTAAAGSMSAADKTKLDGVQAGATANSTDAFLLDRANHTGTQTSATISDFVEAVQDVTGGALVDSTTVNFTYDDVANTITAAVLDSPTVGGATPAQLRDRATHTGTQTAATISDFAEAVQDVAGAAFADSATVNFTYDDVAGTVTAAVLDSPTVGGATPAQLRDRSTHTGTQTASTISDFDTQVRTSRLDQMAAPTAAVNANNQRITGLASPTDAGDAANKGYVDGIASGLDIKASVRVASTANIALATGGLLTIDGITLAAGDRVLVKNQTTAAENGIYVAASGAWTRAADADTSAEVTPGMFAFVEQGTANSDTGWVLTTDGPITLGTTALTFAQFSGAGTYTAGNGLQLSGTQFSVKPVASGGISVGTGGVSVDPVVVARKFTATIGDGVATSFTITHNLNTRSVMVSVFLNSGTYEEIMVDVEKTTVNSITVRFATAPTTGQYAVAVVG